MRHLSLKDYGVFKFRKTTALKDKTATFIFHVSTDNCYKLLGNGKQGSQGPIQREITLSSELQKSSLQAEKNLSEHKVDTVVWKEKIYPLKGGRNILMLWGFAAFLFIAGNRVAAISPSLGSISPNRIPNQISQP